MHDPTAHDGAHIVKLGGSLLDLPDLPERINAYRAATRSERALVVVGGGVAADIVRRFDHDHALGEQTAHWLAVRAMQFNAHLFAAALPGARLVGDPTQCAQAWQAGASAVMDPVLWLEREERGGVRVPHCWQFTSDSIAAHVAHQLGAARLSLLKSALPERDHLALDEAARLALVDERFPTAAQGIACVELVNLRNDGWPCCLLQQSL